MKNDRHPSKAGSFLVFFFFLLLLTLGFSLNLLNSFSETIVLKLDQSTKTLFSKNDHQKALNGFQNSSIRPAKEDGHNQQRPLKPNLNPHVFRPIQKSSSPVSVIFPDTWWVHSRKATDLSSLILQKVKSEIAWPKHLSLHHFYPRISARKTRHGHKEIFLNFKIKVQGFIVPSAHLRVMAFSKDSENYKLSLVQHNLHTPFPEEFSIRTSKKEAILSLQSHEKTAAPIWNIEGVWNYTDKKWKPSWKVQLKDSPKTYFVDVRTGQWETRNTEVAASRKSPYLRPRQIEGSEYKTLNLIGMATPELGNTDEWQPFPLSLATSKTPIDQILIADQNGLLSTLHPAKTLSFLLRNPFVDVLDAGEEPPEIEVSKANNSDIIYNPQKSKRQGAMVNAFVYLTRAHDFLINQVGLDQKPLNSVLNARVNSNIQMCNAHYRNGVVTFYDETSDCRNSAFDTALYHEYAHFADDVFGGINDISLSEGMGDVLATFMTKQPLIGQKIFKKTSGSMRTAELTVQFIPKTNPDEDDRYAAYQRAQAWSGWAWNTRLALIATHGSEQGETLAQKLFLTPLETDAPDIPSAVAEVFARNSEGNPIESSPNFQLLKNTALHHGLFPESLAK
ncbi:MAG: hypothetical protein RJB66_1287 [Pseudomonadota bacterium]|jgi:hypothetical protein